MREALSQSPREARGRIEGGIDVVVLGANFEGLAAATLLAKAGLKTVLAGWPTASLELSKREFAPEFYCIDGEPLIVRLDPELVRALELYRHGLRYLRRRIDSLYVFADGGMLRADGDLYRARESVAAMSPADAERFAAFLESVLDSARALRDSFSGGPIPRLSPPLSSAIERFLSAAVADVVKAAFADERLRDLIVAEALMRRAARPRDPFSFAGLLDRWSGEACGLQGAAAYAENGSEGVLRAARRAAQIAGVDIRAPCHVARILVEQDSVGGVETEDGRQIRARVVVSALPAAQVFLDLIGRAQLDIEFVSAVSARPPAFASAAVHFALSGSPVDGRAMDRLQRRIVYVPALSELDYAFSAARRGEVSAPLMLEAVAVSMFDFDLAPETGLVLAALVHPVPLRETVDGGMKARIATAARATLERALPGASARVVAVDVRTRGDDSLVGSPMPHRLEAWPSVAQAWARARTLLTSSGIRGHFFCGPEAQTGPGLSGAPARRAAQEAIRYARSRAAA